MSKRALEKAYDRYPLSMAVTPENLERNAQRLGYWLGYEQAEKDLALTWEDIRAIDELLTLVYEPDNEEEYYTRVLEEFNRKREEK